ncbi:hypothetical protein VDR60_03430 [Xanthomonas campestris pv. campestris]|nr:hypothetical protein [Xanthomonas campestris pv. campestris]
MKNVSNSVQVNLRGTGTGWDAWKDAVARAHTKDGLINGVGG